MHRRGASWSTRPSPGQFFGGRRMRISSLSPVEAVNVACRTSRCSSRTPHPYAWMAGVNPGAVQRILRHSDPRITTETYGHLQPDYLRSEIDRLRFGTAPANDLSND